MGNKILEELFAIQRVKRVTKKDLAERIKTSPSNLTKWELGQAKPSIDKVEAMAEQLGYVIKLESNNEES